jgi:D-alanyl-D-alanine carboxypeptidase
LQPTATPVPHPKLVTKPPTVSAAGAIAIEVDTGRILYAKDPHRQLPMASTTKIMTALTLLSMPGIDLNAKTLIVPDDLVGEANMALYSGERISLMSLLIGLMTNSANEAGMALARYGGSLLPGAAGPVERFVARMNAHAQELGMYDSHYSNPHGLDQDGHYSSAFDLAISGWYSLRYPTLVNLMQIDSYRAEGHSFYNVNNFLRRYPGANGIKPGLTDNAGRCLIASATNYGHTVIVVVLNAPDLVNDVDTMMDYSFSLLNQQAELQAEPAGLPPYIGLPDGDRLIPFDTRPLFDFFRALGTGAGSWFQAVRRKS